MKNVLEYLERTAGAFPKKLAVEDAQGSRTWEQLLDQVRRVGSGLSASLPLGAPVGVLMEKGIPALTGFLGTVCAGGFYTPLNPRLPPARLAQMAGVLQPEKILVHQDTLDLGRSLFPPDRLVLVEDLLQSPQDLERLGEIRRRMTDTQPLYVLFTSGSTGIPKGVTVSHRCVLDFLEDFTGRFPLSPQDKLGCQAPFDFDVSVKDIYASLKTGAALSLLPQSLFSRPGELMDWLVEKRVTVLIWAASALCLVSAFHGLDYRLPAALRRVMFSGEEMPPKHLDHWRSRLPQAEFVNLYGPTEITCNCTYHILDPNRNYRDGVPIGKAFPHRRVFLLDREDREIREPGQPGEVCVAGPSLALGYYRNREQTAVRFTQNPLSPHQPDRIYRTGDLASYGEEGELYFRGRRDFQVKYLGHRIELEEIQRAAADLPGVDQCCCVFHREKGRLWGFYTGTATSGEVRRELGKLLPGYMVPGSLRRLDRFPLTKNGKIDRAALLRKEGSHD